MTFITGHHRAIRELAEALGIDPHESRGFTLTVDAGQPVIVEVRSLIKESSIGALSTTLKKYKLEEQQ